MVRENDQAPKLDETDIAEADEDDENTVSQPPFMLKWLVSIIISAVENKPGLSNGDLHSILAPYGKPGSLLATNYLVMQ